jgi:branched-chain amino acid transport system ATP-binding protein
LFNLITGDETPDAGAVWLGSVRLDALPPHMRSSAGVGRSYQIPQPFGAMTVFENLVVASAFGRTLRESSVYDGCFEVLGQTGLLKKANDPAGSLTLLDRKRLELARALAAGPRLLLLDEIAGGLTQGEASELVALIHGVKRQGVTILWIEHVIHALTAVADELLVLDAGRKLLQGEPRQVMADPEVKRIYMGIEA